MPLSKCTRKVLQSLRLALLVCKWTKPGKRALHSVSVLWSSLDPSFLEAIQAQETRGWVDRSLFPEGTRNLNLSQALDPLPSLPLRSEFLWNASPPAALLLISCSASVVEWKSGGFLAVASVAQPDTLTPAPAISQPPPAECCRHR